MTKYFYEALKDNKTTINGEIEALTPRDAREKVRALGLLPLKVFNPDLLPGENNFESSNFGSVKSLGLTDKIMFTSELQVLLSASIPVVEALNTIEINSPKPKLKRIASELKNAIMSGMTFAQAIDKYYHDVFGNTYIDLCIAGEHAGELDVTLSRMLTILKKQDDIKARIIQASIYPVILVLVMFAVLVLFSKIVFPIFGGIMIANNTDIPCFAKTVIGICSFVGKYWGLCLLGILSSIGLLNLLATNETTRGFFDRWFLSIPIVNEFIQYVSLSNYVCVLQISYEAGIPLMNGLEMATHTVGNKEIRKKADLAKLYASKGAVLSEAFSRSYLLPGSFVTMIASGEKSGNLSKMLKDIVDVIDKKVNMVIEALTRAFEPFMMMVLGAMTLIIAVAFFQMYMGMSTSFM